jgi:hypothetical protein
MEVLPNASSHTWRTFEDPQPVRVVIAFGTTKRDAIAALREIERAILNHFDAMIGNELTNIEELEAETDRRLSEKHRQEFNNPPRAKVA